jgi:hypothetical protein
MPSLPDFLRTFADRRQCFADLLEFSKRQLGLVESDDYAQLLGLLGGKQRIIGRLETIGKARPRLWDEWRAVRDRLSALERQACEQTLAESESLLVQILEHERASTDRLTRRRDETAYELRGVATGSRVNQAYGDSFAHATHRHLDMDQ